MARSSPISQIQMPAVPQYGCKRQELSDGGNRSFKDF